MPKKAGTCHYSECHRKALPDSKDHYCICHEKSDDKNIGAFNEEIEKIMQDKKAEFYDFRGFYFPPEFNFGIIHNYLKDRTFKKGVDFTKATFQGQVYFSNVKFQELANFSYTIFQKKADFQSATFQEGMDYENSTLNSIHQKRADFENAIFKEDANFMGATFQYAIFDNTKFQGNVHFSSHMNNYCLITVFHHAIFKEAKFQKWADFRDTRFDGYVDFTEATFQEADFRNTKFKGLGANFSYTIFQKKAEFEDCTIEKGINFQYAKFRDEVSLTNIKETSTLDFRNARFSDSTWIGAGTDLKNALFNLSRVELVNFTGAQFPQKIYEERLLEKKYKKMKGVELAYCLNNWEEVSSIYRKLKQAHQRYGDYGTAGGFYYREMECKKRALREKRFSLDWFKSCGYSFLKHSCGYGEKPLRVMRNSLISVLGFAFAYFLTNSINLSGDSVLRNILQSIYFSTITFTTLGYGDIQPINDAGRVLAMSEAVLGAIFIALFIFVFGRKMMR